MFAGIARLRLIKELVRSEQPVVEFLQAECAVSEAALELAWRGCNHVPHLLPMALWQYGLITLDELERALTWSSQTADG